MRRSRRMLIALCAVALLAASCSDDGDTASESSTDQTNGSSSEAPTTTVPVVDPSLCPVAALDDVTQPVEITFWHAMTERNEQTLQELADSYNASQSKVKVTLAYQGTYRETLDKYIAALRSGDLPDMVQMEETSLQIMLDSQSTVPVASCVEADSYDTSDIVPALLQQYSVDGQLATWPFQLSNPVLYYNKAAFRRAGLDPEKPPATLDEMLAASRTIVSSGSTPKAFAMQMAAWYPEQWTMRAGQALVDHDNGRTGRAEHALLDSDAFGATLDWVETMNKEGLVVNVGRDLGLRDGLLKVAVGEAAMTINTSAALGTIYDNIASFPDVELGVAPLPGPGGAGGVTVGGGSLYMSDRSSDEEKAASWDFMKYLLEPESQAKWHIGTGYIPARISAAALPEVQELWKSRPGFKVAYDQLAAASAPPGGGFPVIGDYSGFRDTIATALESILNGTPAAQAQQQAQAAADDVLANYNKRIGG